MGPAYATCDPQHLLNVPASKLSVDANRACDFLEWASARVEGVTGESFLPRGLYGDYLRHALDDAARASSGPGLVRITGEAIALHRASTRGGDTRVRVAFRDGRSIWASHVVLALGNPPPRPLAGDEGRVLNDPWRGCTSTAIRRDDSVVLVGTGLTAVDVALSLVGRGHRTPIRMVSRHGLLPRARRSPARTTVPSDAAADSDDRAIGGRVAPGECVRCEWRLAGSARRGTTVYERNLACPSGARTGAVPSPRGPVLGSAPPPFGAGSRSIRARAPRVGPDPDHPRHRAVGARRAVDDQLHGSELRCVGVTGAAHPGLARRRACPCGSTRARLRGRRGRLVARCVGWRICADLGRRPVAPGLGMGNDGDSRNPDSGGAARVPDRGADATVRLNDGARFHSRSGLVWC